MSRESDSVRKQEARRMAGFLFMKAARRMQAPASQEPQRHRLEIEAFTKQRGGQSVRQRISSSPRSLMLIQRSASSTASSSCQLPGAQRISTPSAAKAARAQAM